MPVERVAVLSDVHGCAPVLEAVLDDPEVSSADLVVVTGDHVSGPMPVETMELLLGLGDRAVLVRGNADREVVAMWRDGERAEHAESRWAAEQLPASYVDRLEALPHPVILEVGGFGQVLFCHGSPRDDDEVVLVDTRLSRWAEVLADLPAEVRTVIGGHTHMPFVRLVDGRVVANSGSLGMPYGSPGGSWLMLDRGAITLRRTGVDLGLVAERVLAESRFPGRERWVTDYLLAPASDVEAVEVFGPRDGRDQMTP